MPIKPLSPVDQLFLFIERRQQPMHVAGLQLFSFPNDAPDDYVRSVAEMMREYDDPEPPFNQHLVTRLGLRHWEEDDQFDLDHHFRYEALPQPGRIRELLALVSAEHANLLHRDRPMWECHLIEGLSGRRFALYTKIHHAVVDGMAAMRMARAGLSTDENQRDMPPVWAIPRPHKTRETGDDYATGAERLAEFVGKQLGTIPTVARELAKVLDRGQRNPDYVSIFQAPQCAINERITGSRRFAAQSYSMPRVKAIAKAYDATLNDVVLAMCGGALRRYLHGIDALPSRPLVAMIPVSLSKDEERMGGNQIAMILANLATHIEDAGERMRVVRASVQEGKARYAQFTPDEALNFTALLLAPTFLNLVTGLAPQLHAFNVVISNVPGPKEPLYWNGAQMVGMYPVSLVIDRMALNITLTSYGDSLEFGIIGCRRTLPSMQRLLDHLEKAIEELEEAAGLQA